jgi:hypothetical protein
MSHSPTATESTRLAAKSRPLSTARIFYRGVAPSPGRNRKQDLIMSMVDGIVLFRGAQKVSGPASRGGAKATECSPLIAMTRTNQFGFGWVSHLDGFSKTVRFFSSFK